MTMRNERLNDMPYYGLLCNAMRFEHTHFCVLKTSNRLEVKHF